MIPHPAVVTLDSSADNAFPESAFCSSTRGRSTGHLVVIPGSVTINRKLLNKFITKIRPIEKNKETENSQKVEINCLKLLHSFSSICKVLIG